VKYKNICKTCGKEFEKEIKRNNGYRARFCSKKCVKPKVEKICEFCKKPYLVISYRKDKSHYCNNNCKKKAMVGEKSSNWQGGLCDPLIYQKAEWRKISKEIIKRDKCCQNCGSTNHLQVNHIIPYRVLQSHTYTNLVTLCRKCHLFMDDKIRHLLKNEKVLDHISELISQMWQLNLKDAKHKKFLLLIDEMVILHRNKNANYGSNSDPFANFRECEKFGIPAWLGCLVRMSDKWSRLINLANGVPDKVGESITDTLLDLSIYAMICKILFEEKKYNPLQKNEKKQKS